MKISIIFTLLVLTCCYGQEMRNTQDTAPKINHQKISESSLYFGRHNSVLNCKPMADSSFLLYIKTENNFHKRDFYFLKMSPVGDSICSFPISFDNFLTLTDYIELSNCYYVIATDRRASGDFNRDFLCKYDKNWKLIWAKKIDVPKYPDGRTVLILTKNNELLVISDEFTLSNLKSNGLSFRRYSLEGKLISKKLMLTEGVSNPVSIIESTDNNYFLTIKQLDQTGSKSSLLLLKLNQKGDTIWTKKYSNFYPNQTILTTDGNLVFYGHDYQSENPISYDSSYLKIIALDNKGTLKWNKIIKRNYCEDPGDILEMKNGNLLFSSTITPLKDKGRRAYLLELDKNGTLIFDRKFEYSLGINSVPFLINGDGQITMIGQKYIGKFGDPFHDIIQLTKLTEL